MGAPARASRLRAVAAVAVAVVVSGACWLAPTASAVQASQSRLVNAVPAADTPAVNDGVVYAIAQVGSRVILGGTFTSVSPAGDPGTTYSLHDALAFDATTGTIDTTGFLPTLNGRVSTVIAGPSPNEVYLGGAFTTVDGVAMNVALLDVRTGALVAGWDPPSLNGLVDKLVLADHRLFVGGRFTTAGSATHRGLVALDSASGALTSYVNLSFTGHHNYETKCDPSTAQCANGTTGVTSLDVNPAGNRMVVIGNFTDVSGQDRDQIVMLTLGKSSATVDASWDTLAYTSSCFSNGFDSYVRDVQFAPDGSYFVVAATGGIGTNSDGTNSSCDAAARFETAATGTNVRPVWIDYSGEDTISTIAVTGRAVYVGGHQRWLNNSLGLNVAAPGAVPRPGLAALSPVSGLPYTWDPGRNPRGAGVFALLATSTGLWVGSDTNWIGNGTYLRPRIAYFPLAGGESPPPERTPALPGRVYRAGAINGSSSTKERLAFREFNGKSVGASVSLRIGVDWSAVHGAFTVDGKVFYGGSDGFLYSRSFNGTTVGAPTKLDPYDDPAWDNVQTGSGQTYQGEAPTFLSEIPSVTSMFFEQGRLFYTMSGSSVMHWRWFEPESGIVGADEFTVSGSFDFSHVAGAFLAGDRLYFASSRNGKLGSVKWSDDRAVGTAALVSASTSWASHGLFLLSQSTNPTPPPKAAFSRNCGPGLTCQLKASRSVDPDGGAVRYRWEFGDHSSTVPRKSTAVSHRYTAGGRYRVKLTVTNTAGATASSSHVVKVRAATKKKTKKA
ncbi:MAG TPA: PKD domain-containing protein [Mycobacteriales bacterium]|jgi:PKD repeat protein|nr:PKD domain-containing protein [Mycobacteriales bacterium]